MRRDVVNMQTTTPIQHKSFTFSTSTEWVGGKACTISALGKHTFRVSSPPEFRGERNVWTPEDLFVGAIETCLLMTFSSLVLKQELPVDAYYSEAAGLLEFAEGSYRFTRVVVKPTIIVENEKAVQPVLAAIKRAHRECLVANSLLTTVVVEPEIRLRDAA
ncbi:MAG TPA: OsmC family protein [Thermoanaerobaculia bacterium]|nr:OsmC family protein [Thermoanaerobaculia bacterium]